jgi:hypothetical protein
MIKFYCFSPNEKEKILTSIKENFEDVYFDFYKCESEMYDSAVEFIRIDINEDEFGVQINDNEKFELTDCEGSSFFGKKNFKEFKEEDFEDSDLDKFIDKMIKLLKFFFKKEDINKL